MSGFKILLGFTTTFGSDISGKLKEISQFEIEEFAFFPTCLEREDRFKLYEEFERLGVKSIPHVHLRTDMGEDELELLIQKFKTKVFNLHSLEQTRFPVINDFKKYAKQIFLENSEGKTPTEKELNFYGGLCIDFAHLENDKKNLPKNYEDTFEKMARFNVGCAHVSAVRIESKEKHLDFHMLKDFSDLDYMKKYKKFLPEFVSLELENSFEEQLEIREYLKQILKE